MVTWVQSCLQMKHFPLISSFGLFHLKEKGSSRRSALEHLEASDNKRFYEWTYCTPVIRGKEPRNRRSFEGEFKEVICFLNTDFSFPFFHDESMQYTTYQYTIYQYTIYQYTIYQYTIYQYTIYQYTIYQYTIYQYTIY